MFWPGQSLCFPFQAANERQPSRRIIKANALMRHLLNTALPDQALYRELLRAV